MLSPLQSGFRKQHSTITAALKVLNDLIEAMDSKRYCVALFIDLSKAFDTVDHNLLIQTLHHIGLFKHAAAWFANYLSNRTQCVQVAGSTSSFLDPFYLQFISTIFVITCQIQCITLEFLQVAFSVIQSRLDDLKLVLNTDKTKLMVFSHAKVLLQNITNILTTKGKPMGGF